MLVDDDVVESIVIVPFGNVDCGVVDAVPVELPVFAIKL